MNRTNCKNCGAPLPLGGSREIKCCYCGTVYKKDNYGRLEDYYVIIELFGKKMKFYISEIQCEPVYDTWRGDLYTTKINEHIKLELISYQ